MSIGGSASKSKSSSTSTSNPWSEVMPYITGQNGVLQKASDLYGKSGTASPELTQAFADLTKAGQTNAATAASLAGSLPRAQQVTGKYITDVPQVEAASVDPKAAFAAFGEIDPTSAFKDLLSGDVTNTYIDKKLSANTDATKAAFSDLTSDAADQLGSVDLPAIRAGANLSGQYGGSRQGIAEGVAKGKAQQQLDRSAASLAASLAQTNAGTLSDAYEAAQSRKAGAASGLGSLATQVATGNADRQQRASEINAQNALDTSKFNVSNDADLNKFNTGVTLNNNAQQMDAAKTGSDLTSSAYDQILQGLTGETGYSQQQLQSFADLIAQYAQLGGTTNTKGKSSSIGLTAKYGG